MLIILANNTEDMRDELVTMAEYRANVEKNDVLRTRSPERARACKARQEVWEELAALLKDIPILPRKRIKADASS